MDVTIACPCPPKATGEPRHESDTVSLRDKLGFQAAMTIRKQMYVIKAQDQAASTGEILAAMTEHYLLFGIEGWSVVDDKGKPVPVSRAAIREFLELIDFDTAELLTDAADGLYAELVLLPLVAKASKLSPPTPTEGSIFRRTGSPTKPPKRSKRSSITTSPTDATGTITQLPVGASSSSPNSKSAR
jgi:hypothetical protein